MRRRMRTPRFPTCNSGQFGRLLPYHWSLLCPGETLKSAKFSARFQSVPIDSPLAGAYVDHWLFWCPLRVLDSNFVDAISNGSGSLPTLGAGASLASWIFEKYKGAGGVVPSWHRLMYQRLFFDWFSNELDVPAIPAWQSTPFALNLPDVTGEFTDRARLDTTMGYTVNVSPGTPDTFALADLENAQAQRRYDDWRNSAVGESYEDYLRSQGVNVEGNAITSSEKWFSHRQWIMPTRAVEPTTGQTTQVYMFDANLSLDRPRFAKEHGLIMGCLSIRPKVLNGSSMNITDQMNLASEFPFAQQPDRLRALSLNPAKQDDASPAENHMALLDDLMTMGHHQVGKTNGWTSPIVSTDNESARRSPTAQWDALPKNATDPVLGTDHFTFDGVFSAKIATPLSFAPIEVSSQG